MSIKSFEICPFDCNIDILSFCLSFSYCQSNVVTNLMFGYQYYSVSLSCCLRNFFLYFLMMASCLCIFLPLHLFTNFLNYFKVYLMFNQSLCLFQIVSYWFHVYEVFSFSFGNALLGANLPSHVSSCFSCCILFREIVSH